MCLQHTVSYLAPIYDRRIKESQDIDLFVWIPPPPKKKDIVEKI